MPFELAAAFNAAWNADVLSVTPSPTALYGEAVTSVTATPPLMVVPPPPPPLGIAAVPHAWLVPFHCSAHNPVQFGGTVGTVTVFCACAALHTRKRRNANRFKKVSYFLSVSRCSHCFK